jgi:glycerol-3-phosphate dehydrogenase (NAD(P)+)
MKRIAILGAGGMGTALALLFARTAHVVHLWTRDRSRALDIQRSRENTRHLSGVPIPGNVIVTDDPSESTQSAELIVVAVPTQFLRSTLMSIRGQIAPGRPVLSVVKGIENSTFARPSQIIRETLGDRPVSVLSGPSHAEELARGLPASVVAAGPDETLNIAVRDALNLGVFRVYTNPDGAGVELAGALKNILGVAAGVCDGLRLGDNSKAALLTRGLTEITRFGVELGARQSTFFGLAGVGDVIATCYSPFGRNRAVGERLGRGETLDQILASMVDVAEGVPTTRSVHDQAHQRGVDVPITDELYEILFQGKSPGSALLSLMDRIPKVEWM